jgi:hypothetical protein
MAGEPEPESDQNAERDPFDEPRFSRARTLDHEVRRLPTSQLELKRQQRLQTVSEELQTRQTNASERNATWARWAALLALLAILVAVLQQVR